MTMLVFEQWLEGFKEAVKLHQEAEGRYDEVLLLVDNATSHGEEDFTTGRVTSSFCRRTPQA